MPALLEALPAYARQAQVIVALGRMGPSAEGAAERLVRLCARERDETLALCIEAPAEIAGDSDALAEVLAGVTPAVRTSERGPVAAMVRALERMGPRRALAFGGTEWQAKTPDQLEYLSANASISVGRAARDALVAPPQAEGPKQ